MSFGFWLRVRCVASKVRCCSFKQIFVENMSLKTCSCITKILFLNCHALTCGVKCDIFMSSIFSSLFLKQARSKVYCVDLALVQEADATIALG